MFPSSVHVCVCVGVCVCVCVCVWVCHRPQFACCKCNLRSGNFNPMAIECRQ